MRYKFTENSYGVDLLHYGNKYVFLRDNAGDEFIVSRPFFDEWYKPEGKP